MERPNRNLPTLTQLYSGDIEKAQKQNNLVVLLNQKPKKSWIKTHPLVKRKNPETGKWEAVKYLPIARVEFLLTAIYVNWAVEIRDFKMIANSVSVSIRLYYDNPITSETEWTDGIGASPLQTEKDAGAIEWDKIKNNAVMLALPAAESYAKEE